MFNKNVTLNDFLYSKKQLYYILRIIIGLSLQQNF